MFKVKAVRLGGQANSTHNFIFELRGLVTATNEDVMGDDGAIITNNNTALRTDKFVLPEPQVDEDELNMGDL